MLVLSHPMFATYDACPYRNADRPLTSRYLVARSSTSISSRPYLVMATSKHGQISLLRMVHLQQQKCRFRSCPQ